MSELILSKECFDAEYEIEFRNFNRIYMYENYVTDGEMVLDLRKNYYPLKDIKKLEKYKFDSAIGQYIQEDYLKKNVLKEENSVTISPISYNFVTLLKGKPNHLIGNYYAQELRGLDLFYYDNKIYFFEYLDAEPEIGIDFGSYMFIGMIMGIIEKHKTSENNLKILEKIDKFLNTEGQ